MVASLVGFVDFGERRKSTTAELTLRQLGGLEVLRGV
jgi:hypothetical protein